MPRSLRTEQEVQRIVVDAFEDGIKAARAAMASYMASYVLLPTFLQPRTLTSLIVFLKESAGDR